MSKYGKRYSPEFKERATNLAKEIGISQASLDKWSQLTKAMISMMRSYNPRNVLMVFR